MGCHEDTGSHARRTRSTIEKSHGIQSEDALKSLQRFSAWTFQDWQANSRSREGRLIAVWFRSAQWGRKHWGTPGKLYAAFYTLYTSLYFGVEIPVAANIGPGLTLFHPHTIVIHPSAVIGRNCTLRQGVTIGNTTSRSGERSGTPDIGDDVEFGAHATALGAITIASQARIGAMAVVLKDVPDGAVVVGNPGRVIPKGPNIG